MKKNNNWCAAAFALLCALSITSAYAAQETAPPISQLRDIVVDKGGRLALHQTDVLVEAHDECRWPQG